MSKYDPLERYLRTREESRLTLTFRDVERIIGAKLPASSFRYDIHWTDDWPTRPGRAIRSAGWGVESVDRIRETITLTR